MNDTKSAFRSINWRLYLVLIVSALLPVLYTTLRIRFLGALPGDWGFNIASQLSWMVCSLVPVQITSYIAFSIVSKPLKPFTYLIAR